MRSLKQAVLILATLGLMAVPVMAGDTLLMATTTSTDNTGLLDYLSPLFIKDTGIALTWTATGTGKALKLGENCDVDVLLVHAPEAEKEYLAKGFGIDRREVMYNDFVIIGPATDPAGIKGKGVDEALARIRSKQSLFASRGDHSGTHTMEISLWNNAGQAVPDKEAWYIQTGQGMLSTITIAAERKGYTMTDRGTYITYQHTQGGNPALVVLVEGDGVLLNQYSIITVNPERCDQRQYLLAKRLSDWLTRADIQKRIGAFTLLGKPLFVPNADNR